MGIFIQDIEPTIYVGNESNISGYCEDEMIYPSQPHEPLVLTDLAGDSTAVYPSGSTTIYDVTMQKSISRNSVGYLQPWMLPFDYMIEANTGIQFYGIKSIEYDYAHNYTTVYYDELPVGFRIPQNTPILIKLETTNIYEIRANGVQINEHTNGVLTNCYDGTNLRVDHLPYEDVYAEIYGTYQRSRPSQKAFALNIRGELISVASSVMLSAYRWYIHTTSDQDVSNYGIEEAIDDYSVEYFTLKSYESGNTFTFTNNIDYSLDDGSTWTTLSANTASPSVNKGKKISFKAQLAPNSSSGIGTFSATGQYEAQGNAMSLLFDNNFIGKTDFQRGLIELNYAFIFLFSGSTGLTSAQNLSLPATTLANQCYRYMFYNCTSLTTAPELPADTMTIYCYDNMFNGCTNLSYIKMLATDISATNCLSNWVQGVSATGTFVKDASQTSLPSGASGIPDGWTVQNA